MTTRSGRKYNSVVAQSQGETADIIWGHKYSLGSGINIHYNSKVSWPSRLFRHYEIIKATRHCGTAVSFRVARARAISPPKLGIAFRSPNMSQNHACTYATQAHAHTGVVSLKPRAWRPIVRVQYNGVPLKL